MHSVTVESRAAHRGHRLISGVMRYTLAATVFLVAWGVPTMTSVGDHDDISTVLVIGGSILAAAGGSCP